MYKNSTVEKVFREFCESTSIPTVRHVVDRRRHWFERFWWAIAISVSIFFCLKWLDKTLYKRTYTPVIITTANEATQIVDIPFPAITICSNLISNRFYLDATTILKLSEVENYQNISIGVQAIQKHSTVANFCNLLDPYLDDYKKYINFTFDPNVLEHLQKMSPDILDGFNLCSLDDAIVRNCRSFFHQVVSDVGLCYTFNHLSDIYNIDLVPNKFPLESEQFSHHFNPYKSLYRMKNSGIGLRIQLQIPIEKTSFDGKCNDYHFDGLKMQIHPSNEVSYLKKHFIHIPYDHDVHITVSPHIMSTSQNVIDNYQPEQRKCIDQRENQLEFFKTYTQRNCRLDEFVRHAEQNCRCVMIWMPRHKATNVCHLRKEFDCIRHVSKRNLLQSATKCLPACNSISYETRMTASKLTNRNSSDNRRYVSISIAFEDQQYFASIRSELYGTMDFVSQCGGILSLFMGISILNLVEIVYFATIRIIFRSNGNDGQ